MRLATWTREAAAAFAVLAVPLAGAAAAAGTASAATPSCGSTCINIFPRIYSGQSLHAPQFVLDVLRQGEKTGQPVILFRASNSDPAEDWTYANQGNVSDFYAAGLVSSSVAIHLGCVTGTGPFEFPTCSEAVNDPAYELEYAPFGVDSGLCMGLAATAVSGGKVTLQPCGVSSRTVWIRDTNLNDFSPLGAYYAAVNGSDTNFSQPFVLTYPSGSYPTDMPRAQAEVANLTGFSASVDNDSQLWTGFAGVLP